MSDTDNESEEIKRQVKFVSPESVNPHYDSVLPNNDSTIISKRQQESLLLSQVFGCIVFAVLFGLIFLLLP